MSLEKAMAEYTTVAIALLQMEKDMSRLGKDKSYDVGRAIALARITYLERE